MKEYLELLEETKLKGVAKGDRTGTGTFSRFGDQLRFNLRNNNLPVVTTKYIHLHSVKHELEWMKSGETNLKYLLDNKVTIWNEWAIPGTEKYRWLTIDEINEAIKKRLGITTEIYTVTRDHPVNNECGWECVKESDDRYTIYVDSEKINDCIISPFSNGLFENSDVLTKPLEYQQFNKLYQLIFNKEPKVLVDAQLGHVYGKMWRDIEDTRIVNRYYFDNKEEWAKLQKRGFEWVSAVNSDSIVITRRVDQLKDVLHQLEHNPDSRRIIICAWNPSYVEDQALPPCHSLFQFWTRELTLDERYDLYIDKINKVQEEVYSDIAKFPDEPLLQMYPNVIRLVRQAVDHEYLDGENIPKRAISCQLYARSQDTFLGTPFNITFYSILTHQLAHQFNMVAEEFIWTGGDIHLYSNHTEQADKQLSREPNDTPTIKFNCPVGTSILDMTADSYEIIGYEHQGKIPAPVAV